jgi:hypothetical protein
MSDPVPAIAESEATGSIAEIVADIHSVHRVGVVNLIWRHLATIPGGLPWVWTMARPLYADGTVGREATALRAGLSLPELPAWPTAALKSAGLQDGDIAGIRTVLAAYDRTNAMALIVFWQYSSGLKAHHRRWTPSPATLPRLQPSRYRICLCRHCLHWRTCRRWQPSWCSP